MKSLLVCFTVLFAGAAGACSFDTDCAVGSQCVKQGGLYGSCVGGMSPGNNNDSAPVRYTNDISGKKGNTCSYDTDCGVGGQCVKGSGLNGTCM